METADELKARGSKCMEAKSWAEGADFLFRAYQADPERTGCLSDCGANLWIGAHKSLLHLASVTISGCKSNMPDEIFLTYLLQPSRYPGGRLAAQVRAAVPDEIIEKLRTCVRVAESLFRRAEPRGGTLWRLDLLRGTGRFDEARSAFREAIKQDTISRDLIPNAERIIDQIKLYEQDFAWLDNAAGGWVIPSADRVSVAEIDRLYAVAQRIETELCSVDVPDTEPTATVPEETQHEPASSEPSPVECEASSEASSDEAETTEIENAEETILFPAPAAAGETTQSEPAAGKPLTRKAVRLKRLAYGAVFTCIVIAAIAMGWHAKSSRKAVSAPQTAVVGVREGEIYVDQSLDTPLDSVPFGTQVTLLSSSPDLVKVTFADKEGWMQRCALCSSDEFNMRQDKQYIPERVHVLGAENGSFVLRHAKGSMLHIQNGGIVFEKGDAFWFDATAHGKRTKIGAVDEVVDSGKLYLIISDTDVAQLTILPGKTEVDNSTGVAKQESPPPVTRGPVMVHTQVNGEVLSVDKASHSIVILLYDGKDTKKRFYLAEKVTIISSSQKTTIQKGDVVEFNKLLRMPDGMERITEIFVERFGQ